MTHPHVMFYVVNLVIWDHPIVSTIHQVAPNRLFIWLNPHDQGKNPTREKDQNIGTRKYVPPDLCVNHVADLDTIQKQLTRPVLFSSPCSLVEFTLKFSGASCIIYTHAFTCNCHSSNYVKYKWIWQTSVNPDVHQKHILPIQVVANFYPWCRAFVSKTHPRPSAKCKKHEPLTLASEWNMFESLAS